MKSCITCNKAFKIGKNQDKKLYCSDSCKPNKYVKTGAKLGRPKGINSAERRGFNNPYKAEQK